MTVSCADSAEFQQLIASLDRQWREFLSRSYPSMRVAHADLAQQSAEDLIRYAQSHAWQEVDDWQKFGFRILHRRIADHYRHNARQWAAEPLSDELPTRDASSNPERVVHYSRQLKKLVGVLTGMEEADRHLLLAEILDDGPADRGPLSVAQRKRISRLRAKLRDRLEEPEGGD